MKKFIVNGVIILGIYVLIVLYLFFYSIRIENLNHAMDDEETIITINYGE